MRISSTSGTVSSVLAERAASLTARDWSGVYLRTLDTPGASGTDARANRDFQHLWMRFVATVAEFGRQKSTDATSTGGAPRLPQDSVRRAARDLAENAAAFGARDQWQVVDRIGGYELGGAVNEERQRDLADVAGEILAYLAAHPRATDGAEGVDGWLQDSVERWVAVAGVSDEQVDAMAEPKGPVLLGGPSGTGKTLAAYRLAASLDKELMRIDLSQVVGKYIGETEKNLAAVFKDAERSGAVLLFDEADALFGKRTDVKDSHDRYANQEISYLLERIERHEGIAILATNSSPKLDPDVLKRVATVVAIPLPSDPGPK